MGAASSEAAKSSDRELVVTRIFDAPRSLVFKAWTQREHRMRWWGPRGFTVFSCEMDLRTGGLWRLGMRSPEGREDWQRGTFREVVEPERLVFTYEFEDPTGTILEQMGLPRAGHDSIVTVTFADLDGKTQVTVHHTGFENLAVRDDHVGGWGEALDHLETYLAKASASSSS